MPVKKGEKKGGEAIVLKQSQKFDDSKKSNIFNLKVKYNMYLIISLFILLLTFIGSIGYFYLGFDNILFLMVFVICLVLGVVVIIYDIHNSERMIVDRQITLTDKEITVTENGIKTKINWDYVISAIEVQNVEAMASFYYLYLECLDVNAGKNGKFKNGKYKKLDLALKYSKATIIKFLFNSNFMKLPYMEYERLYHFLKTKTKIDLRYSDRKN